MLRWGREKNEPEAKSAPAEVEPTEVPASPPQPAPPAQGRSLAQVLLDEGKVPRDRLEAALQKQQATGAFLGEVLVEEGLLDEKSLISFLAKHCKIPHLSLLDYLIDKDTVNMVPEEVCRRYRLLPIDRLGRNLTVAMVNPLDQEALQVVRQHCADLRIKPILCAFQHWQTVADRVFSEDGDDKPVELSASSLGLTIPKPRPVVEETTPPATVEPTPSPAAPEPTPSPAAPEPTPTPTPAPPEPTPAAPAPSAAAAPTPTAERAPEEAPLAEAEPFDGDAVFDAVFGGEATAAPEKPAPAPSPTPEAPAASPAGASSIMSEMASVMMDSMRDTYAMLARRMELFRNLDPEDVARIFSRGITIELKAGDTLFEKGDAGDALFVILGGGILIEDNGQEIASLARGDMLGEMALISNEPRSATARATEDTSLLRLTADIIHHVMPRDVSVQLLVNIIVTLSTRLRKANP